jgi:hypothetical protein
MSEEISKHVYKDTVSEAFFVDIEDYTENGYRLQGYEDGDIVKWEWEGIRYIGTLRHYGCSTNGIFIIKDAKKL